MNVNDHRWVAENNLIQPSLKPRCSLVVSIASLFCDIIFLPANLLFKRYTSDCFLSECINSTKQDFLPTFVKKLPDEHKQKLILLNSIVLDEKRFLIYSIRVD